MIEQQPQFEVQRTSARVTILGFLDEGKDTADLIRQLQAFNKAATDSRNSPTASTRRANSQTIAYGSRGTGVLADAQNFETYDAKNDKSIVAIDVVPTRVSYTRAGESSAGKFSIDLDYGAFPFDPRAFRSMGVRIYLGDVDADSFFSGVLGGNGDLSAVISTDMAYRRMTGYVDTMRVDYGDDRQSVSLEGRDNSAVVRDTKLPTDYEIDLSKPIALGIRELLDSLPGTRGFPLSFGAPNSNSLAQINKYKKPLNPSEAGPVPIDSLGLARAKYEAEKVNGKGKGKSKRQNRNGSANSSMWDHMTQVCQRLGLRLVYQQEILFICEPSAQYKAKSSYIAFFGETLSSLSFSRRFEGFSDETVEVRSPDPMLGRTRWARYPVYGNEPKSGILGKAGSPQPVTSRVSKITPLGTPSENVNTFQFPGISSLKTLENIAKQVFESRSRQTIEGTFSTSTMKMRRVSEVTTLTRGSASVYYGDILEAYPGDSVLVLVAPASEIANKLGDVVRIKNTYNELEQSDISLRAQRYMDLGLRSETAFRLASAHQNVAMSSKFQLSGIDVNWSSDDGITIDVSYGNFIVIRDSDADESTKFEQERARGEF